MYPIILVFFYFVASSSGLRNAFRITGGRSSNITDFPHQLSLLMNGQQLCGAVLVKENIALTAAHCIIGPGENFVVRGGSSYKKEHLNEEYPVEIKVKSVETHPFYDDQTHDYDLAILYLEESFELNEFIQTIEITDKAPEIGKVAVVSGWGKRGHIIHISPSIIRSVKIYILDPEDCGVFPNEFSPRMFCAGLVGRRKSACMGDSGGPLTVDGVLYGLVSLGSIFCDQPSVYTNLGDEDIQTFIFNALY